MGSHFTYAASVYAYYNQSNSEIESFKANLETALKGLTPRDAMRFVLYLMSGANGVFAKHDLNSTFHTEAINNCKRDLSNLITKYNFDIIFLLTNCLQKYTDELHKWNISTFTKDDIKNFFGIEAQYEVPDYQNLDKAIQTQHDKLLKEDKLEEAQKLFTPRLTESTKKAINTKLTNYYLLFTIVEFVNKIEKYKNSRENIAAARLALVIASVSACIFAATYALIISNMPTMICVMVISVLTTVLVNLEMKHYASMKTLAINGSIIKTAKEASKYLSDNKYNSSLPDQFNCDFTTQTAIEGMANNNAACVVNDMRNASCCLFAAIRVSNDKTDNTIAIKSSK